MKTIPVIENPHKSKRNGTHRSHMKKKRRKASAAQLRALAKGRAKMAAKRAKKASPARPKRRRSKRRSVLGPGRHRPVIIRRKKRHYRPKRSSLPKHMKLANPFLGGLAMIGNPKRRKSRKHKSSRRRSRRSYRNPFGKALIAAPLAGGKELFKGSFIQEAASVAAGFVLPNVVLSRLPAAFRDARWKGYASKVAVVAVLAGASSMISKRVSKAILLGGGVSLLLDLYTDFVAPMLMRATGVGAYYGDPGDAGVSAYYGDPALSGVSDGYGDAYGSESIAEAWG